MKRMVYNAILAVGLLCLLAWIIYRAANRDWSQATFFFLILIVLSVVGFDRGNVKPSDTFFNPKKKY
jgi:hypothetical protein